MSRIGNKVIEVPDSIEVRVEAQKVIVSAGNKSLEVDFPEDIEVEFADGQINVKRKSDTKKAREQQGLIRSLINNAVTGLVTPFTKTLILKGIGFKVMKKGSNALEFSLGYSHTVPFEVNADVTADVQGQDKIQLSSFNKQLLGEVCANVLSLKKRDNYKGKGIYFDDEVIKKKPGKSVSK